MSKEIEPNFRICHEENNLKRIASGFDSVVYRYGDYVIKVYERERNLKNIKNYMKVTNRAAELTKEENYFLTSLFDPIKIPLRVNPFIDVHKCGECGSVYGIAPYVPGKRLDQFRSIPFTSEEYILALGTTENYFEKRLGVHGIDLMICNVKMLKTKELVVTDLCGNIELLRNC